MALTGPMVRHPLVYSGVGIYVPHVTCKGIVWRRNTDGDPLVGVEVACITNVKKFAELVKVERLQGEETE